jgi:hypothetical protein
MRLIVLLFVAALGACAAMKKAPYPEAQKIVDDVAAKHSNLERLTLHAMPTGKSELIQVASTKKSRRGKPSDPEDMKAMKTGLEIVLDEDGNVDVTIPILRMGGKATAIAGVTLRGGKDVKQADLVNEARTIAKQLADAVSAAGKPVW